MKYYDEESFTLHHGKMEDVLPTFENETIDCIVCDPPYELNFMNKGWDNTGVAFKKSTWEHCFRVLKDGGYLIAFGGTRTYHRIACAIEDAGFEIRDSINWVYGSGFPKSQDVGLMIDKKNGIESEIIGISNKGQGTNSNSNIYSYNNEKGCMNRVFEMKKAQNEWAGYGTSLKPAFEPIIVARKPFKGSLVDNVLKNGVGAINIDECRVGIEGGRRKVEIIPNSESKNCGFGCNGKLEDIGKGRFPSNLITDGSEEVEKLFPYSKGGTRHNTCERKSELTSYGFQNNTRNEFDDEGSAMRYFKECVYSTKDIDYPPIYYFAKASKEDRDEGLDEFEDKLFGMSGGNQNAIAKGEYYQVNDGIGLNQTKLRKNTHPTVKPVELMQYLVRMFAPKGSIVLDPFMGSGSTGKACMYENRERNANYHFIGVEMTDEYLPICKARIEYAKYKYEYEKRREDNKLKEQGFTTIFDFGVDDENN